MPPVSEPAPEGELGPWAPFGVDAATRVFAAAPFRWWISGGLALELHLRRSWRLHDDTDVGICRRDLPAVRTHLAQWDAWVGAAGRLRPWRGEPLALDRHENNLWCRSGPGQPWLLDVTIGEGSDDEWVYRRDPALRRPWDGAVLHSADGTPYLSPELQLLFKSKGLRLKDDVDAAEVIPQLTNGQARFLRQQLDLSHPWHELLGT